MFMNQEIRDFLLISALSIPSLPLFLNKTILMFKEFSSLLLVPDGSLGI